MRVFISFAHDDTNMAAQLEAALRRNNIDVWSALDIAPGEDVTQAIDKKSASADGYVFLLGAGKIPSSVPNGDRSFGTIGNQKSL